MVKKFFEYHYNEPNFENLREYFLNAIDNGFDFWSWDCEEDPNWQSPVQSKHINRHKYQNLIHVALTIGYDRGNDWEKAVCKLLIESNLGILFHLPNKTDIYKLDYRKFFGMEILSRIEDSLGIKLIWIDKQQINYYHESGKDIYHIFMIFGSEKN